MHSRRLLSIGKTCVLAFALLMMLSVFVPISPQMQAQTVNANILGTVTDTSGAVISGATITATNVATGMKFKSVSAGNGSYALRLLPVGSYEVTIAAKGFRAKQIGPFSLEIAQSAQVNVQLEVGTAATTVQVESNFIPLLNTENNTSSTTFTNTAIQTIPLNGRNFSSLTIFLPGAVATDPSAFSGSNGTERNTNQGGQVSVNGNRNQTNNYSLDGIEINETINNLIGYNPAPEALGQVKVISANAPAQYGNVNGGDILAVTKSGTNQWHGSAYYFLENYLLDANTWANKHRPAGDITPRTHFTQSDFGGTLGGPILKNKLFFFMDYEGFRLPQAGLGLASVPTAAMRAGDFSALDHQLFNNANNTSAGPVPYSNNQVPVVNPAAVYLIQHPKLWPLPNATPTAGLLLDNYTAPTRQFTSNNQGEIHIDYEPGPKDTVSVRWLQGIASDGTTVPVMPIAFAGISHYPTKGIALDEVHTFSPNLINEFLAGFTRVRWQQGTPTDTTGVFGTKGDSILGIGAAQPFPGFAALDFGCNGMAGCNGNNIPSNLGNAAIIAQFIDNTFQYGDHLTYIRGNHTLQAGVEILRYQQNGFYGGNNGVLGIFDYYPVSTMDAATGAAGNAVADFELDNSSFIGQGGLDAQGQLAGNNGQRQYRDAFYIQDDWKILPTLTLNLGVRYAYDQPIYEVNNKESNINVNTKTIQLAGQNGASRALYSPTYSNIMPRIGFNDQLSKKLVVHGGFGMTSTLEGTGQNLRLPFNPPFWEEHTGTGALPTTSFPGAYFQVKNGFTPGSAASLAGSTYRMWYGVRPSIISEWSLATQFALTNTLSLKVGYLGETGQHLIQAVSNNQLLKPCQVDGVFGKFAPTSPECAAVDPAPFIGIVGQNGTVVGTTSQGMMSYNALQVSLRQHLADGLEYTVNYAYSHALTNTPGFFGVASISGASPFAQNAYDTAAEYGPSGMDIRNSINGNLAYQLPFGHGQRFGGTWNPVLNEAAGGWQLAATAVWYQGFPVTINGTDNSQTSARAARPNHYRPLRIVNRSSDHWFGTDPSATGCRTPGIDNGVCAYGNTALGTFGNSSVGTERGPGFQQYDFSLFKSFPTFREQKLMLRLDAFNAFNTTSLGNPDNGYGDSTFGEITSVRSIPRQLQVSATYSF